MVDTDSTTITLAKQSSVTFIGNIVGRVFGLGFYVIVIGLVSPDVFGLYTLGLSVVLFVEKFADLNLHRAIDYFVPKFLQEDDSKRATSVVLTVIILSIILSTFIALGVYVFRGRFGLFFNDPRMVDVVAMFVILVPILSLIRTVNTIFVAVKHLEYRVILKDIVRPFLKIIFVTAFLMIGLDLTGLVLGHVAALTFTLLFGVFLVFIKIDFFKDSSGFTTISPTKLVDYSAPLVFAGMIYATVGQIDYYVIGFFMTPADVGFYRIGYLLSGYVLLFHTSLTPVFKPLVAETDSNNALLQHNYRTATKWVTLFTIPLATVIILLPEVFIRILFTDDYVTAAIPAVILVIGRVFNIGIGPAGKTIEGSGRTRITLINTIILVLLNVIGDFLLVPRLGIVGAAIATATALTLTALLAVGEVYYLQNISPFSTSILKIWFGGLVALGVGYLISIPAFFPAYKLLYVPVSVSITYIVSLMVTNTFSDADVEIATLIDERIGYDVFVPLIQYGAT